MKYIETVPQIQYFREANTDYTPAQVIADDSLFQKLMDNKFTKYRNEYVGAPKLNLKFEEIENKVDSNITYLERVKYLPEIVNELKSKIEKLTNKINELRTLPLSQILKSYSADDFYKDCKQKRLIAFLIKAGYIDENYYDYISYFYPGVLTPTDREFILDLKIGIKKDFNYRIFKPKAVINDLHDSLFSRIEVFNINLLDFIVENSADYPTQFISLKNNIKKHYTSNFIESYYKYGQHLELFFNDILPVWSEFFTKRILRANSIEKAKINFEILLRYFPEAKLHAYNNSPFKNYLAENLTLINDKHEVIPTEKIIFLTKSLNLKYTVLNFETFNSNELWEFIINGSYYSLTNLNIQYIIKTINKEGYRKFELASYSTILNLGNTNILNYVNDNIEDCISKIFLEKSIEENEEALISIISNDKITEKTKLKYLSSQRNKINLSDIDVEFYDIALNANIINANWLNVDTYFSIQEDKIFNSVIISFISVNSEELSKEIFLKSNYEPDTDVSIVFQQLIGSNLLPIESYKRISKSFNRVFLAFDLSILEKERIDFLIENNFIKLNDYNFELISSNFPILTHKFLIKKKKEYLSKIDSYTLDTTIAYNLLLSDLLTRKEKFTIIESLSVSILDEKRNLSNKICEFLNSSKKTLSDKSFILELLRNGNNRNEKLNLFVRQCLESEYDKDFVKSGLELLGGNYAAISRQRGHRRKFTSNKVNKLLAEYLKTKNFISKYYEEEGMIKINSRII